MNEGERNENELAIQFQGESLRRLERLRRKIGTPEAPADYATVLGSCFEVMEQIDDRAVEGKIVIAMRDGDHIRVGTIEARVLAAAKQAMENMDDEEWKQ